MTIPVSKTQLDMLGDRLRIGATSDSDLKLLDTFRRTFVPAYENVIGTVKSVLSVEVTGRPAKSTTSIIEKLKRESIRLTQIQDIAGCRFVVSDVLAQDNALADLVGALENTTVVDRRDRPSHGYRAVHVIAMIDDKPIEIQIRTTFQHLWAELSEKSADIFDPAIKYGKGPVEVLNMLASFSSILAEVEADELELQKAAPNPDFEALKLALRKDLGTLINRTAALRKKRSE